MTTRAKQGRKPGTRNRGFFFRKGRGWCTSKGERAILLRDEAGEPLREKCTPLAVVRQSHARQLLAKPSPSDEVATAKDQATILQTCQLYLSHCKATGADATYQNRAATLFDFCFGLPGGFRNRKPSDKEIAESRIHRGYGRFPASDLKPLHVDQWLAAHPTWNGSRRTKVQALKRALNYGVGAGFLTQNPIKGYKTAKSGMRMTYLTPKQEAACYRFANPALAMALKVCIRTGARYGCEFAKLTAKHIHFTKRGMEWRFSEKESKTKKLRIIRVPNTEPVACEVIEIIKRQIQRYPEGPIFRNTKDGPWTRHTLGSAFTSLRKRLKRNGIALDDDACMYSCRHTYAKRTLSGYWTGKPSTIERLAELMGNTREVCWEHYASWCDSYTDPLWESA